MMNLIICNQNDKLEQEDKRKEAQDLDRTSVNVVR